MHEMVSVNRIQRVWWTGRVERSSLLKVSVMLFLYLLYTKSGVTMHSTHFIHILFKAILWGIYVKRPLRVRGIQFPQLHGLLFLISSNESFTCTLPHCYFSFQPVLHDWCNKDRGMCYPLLLIEKSSLCGGSGFPFSLSEWSLTICLTPYNRR